MLSQDSGRPPHSLRRPRAPLCTPTLSLELDLRQLCGCVCLCLPDSGDSHGRSLQPLPSFPQGLGAATGPEPIRGRQAAAPEVGPAQPPPSPLPQPGRLSSQLGSGAHGEEGNLCEGQHVPWTTCWPLPKGPSPPCAPRSDTEVWEPQAASGSPFSADPASPPAGGQDWPVRSGSRFPTSILHSLTGGCQDHSCPRGMVPHIQGVVWATAIFRSLNLLLEGLGSGVQDFLKTFSHLFI